MLKNRIEKNWKKIKAWTQQQNIEAFRLYDRDIPEFQVIVDRYKDHFVIYDKTDFYIDQGKDIKSLTSKALVELFQVSPDLLIWKSRERQSGLQQYERLAETNKNFIVREGPAYFRVNLWDYLDTGLFLDHRPIRQKIFKQIQGKKLLNLFCYTGSISVCAALGGAKTTSVDMSATYLEWAKTNFEQNQINLNEHELIRADVLSWLSEDIGSTKYDCIFLDPPTFSNSKRMEQTFEVERDQDFLLRTTMKKLDSSGILYFSNNKRKFKLDPKILNDFQIRDITKETIPRDFHDQKIHQCYEFRWK